MGAEETLKFGEEHPYDGKPATDAAHRAALGVLEDLRDRRGIKNELDMVDAETRTEIVGSLAEIIRQAGLTEK